MTNLARAAMALSVTLAAALASAQNRPAAFQQVVTIDVRPGQVDEWIDYSTKITEAAQKLGSAQTFQLFHAGIGNSPNRFYVVLPFEKWGDTEDWTNPRRMLIDAFGEKDGLAMYQRGTAAQEHVEIAVQRLLPDHSSNMGKYKREVAPMYQVIQTQVRAHANASYEAWLSLLAKAQNADSTRAPATRRVTTQGTSWLYTTVIPMQNMADLDQPGGAGVADFYGESAAGRLNDMVGDGVVSRTWFVVHHHTNQSYSGPGTTSN